MINLYGIETWCKFKTILVNQFIKESMIETMPTDVSDDVQKIYIGDQGTNQKPGSKSKNVAPLVVKGQYTCNKSFDNNFDMRLF